MLLRSKNHSKFEIISKSTEVNSSANVLASFNISKYLFTFLIASSTPSMSTITVISSFLSYSFLTCFYNVVPSTSFSKSAQGSSPPSLFANILFKILSHVWFCTFFQLMGKQHFNIYIWYNKNKNDWTKNKCKMDHKCLSVIGYK